MKRTGFRQRNTRHKLFNNMNRGCFVPNNQSFPYENPDTVPFSTTWLTKEEKAFLVDDLQRYNISGKRGFSLDEGTYDDLIRLNNICGLASCYSCNGHDTPDEPDSSYVRDVGYLILRPSREAYLIFQNIIMEELNYNDLIYNATMEWKRWRNKQNDNIFTGVRIWLEFKKGNMGKVIDTIVRNMNR